ncbi:MAG: hypothetical protein M1814_005945 [Vezdaea aestivalis]|nr:MAG: hypothetical protein M1814_005945 [Vezdaea aestivalis]
MSSGWTGPGANTSPYNENENRQRRAVKARVKADEAERKLQIAREQAVARGDPPLTEEEVERGRRGERGGVMVRVRGLLERLGLRK